MRDEPRNVFVPIRDGEGNVTGMMDGAAAEYLAAWEQNPTQTSLNALLAGVTRVRVVPFSNFVRGTTEKKVLLDTSDPVSLDSFRGCFAIVEDPDTFGHCMCCGNPHMELYAGDFLTATIGYHHGESIRWRAWNDDAVLKEQDRLLDWMSAHGVDGPRKEVEAAKRRREESVRSAERWLFAMPDCLRPFWGDMHDAIGSELQRRLLDGLREALPSTAAQVLALFGWFGSGAGPWSGFPAYEAVAAKLLLHYPTGLLIGVLADSAPTEPEWAGAARYFESSEFWRTRKGDIGLLPAGLKQQLLEAARRTGNTDNAERAENTYGG
jgi:hypothetical protein